jgi:hypothetical protein
LSASCETTIQSFFFANGFAWSDGHCPATTNDAPNRSGYLMFRPSVIIAPID